MIEHLKIQREIKDLIERTKRGGYMDASLKNKDVLEMLHKVLLANAQLEQAGGPGVSQQDMRRALDIMVDSMEARLKAKNPNVVDFIKHKRSRSHA
jgi:hypothetical protein